MFRFPLLVAGLVLLLTAGCSEDPTEANSLVADLPLKGLVTMDTILQAVNGQSIRQYVPMDGGVNLVGQAGSYRAITVIQFSPTSFPAVDTAVVYSAKLTLHCVSWYGTQGSSFGFDVYRVNRSWSPYTLTWDSLQTGSFYESTVSRGSYNEIKFADTTITVSLDTAMVREWLATSTTSTTTKFGIVLVPSPSTSNAVRGVVEFGAGDSASYYPTLQIIKGNPTGTLRDTSSYRGGIDTFAGTDDHGTGPSTLLYVQGGVNYRSAIRFDFSAIPRGAIVNSATMYLDRDPATSLISQFVTDTTLVPHIIADSVTFRLQDAEDPAAFGRPLPGSPLTFAFNIRKAAQSWIRGPNYGVMVRVPVAREFSTADIYTFFSPNAASSSVRPRVKVVYSIESH